MKTRPFSTLAFMALDSMQAGRTTAAASSTDVISSFKAPTKDTPEDVAARWKAFDEQVWTYVDEHVPAVLDHTGSSAFDKHLKGVQAVLRYWNAPEHLQSAGLFHSIYGTEGFQGFSLPLSERDAIRSMIGEKAENICFWFCMVDRSTLDKTVFDWNGVADADKKYQLRSRPELGRFDIVMSKEEWLDFVELTLADWMEQVEGAASKPSELFAWKEGEAYAYRRLAYRKMSEILAAERSERLGQVTPATLEAVMATESAETRALVQPRTPPMSDAAAAALDALRAIGEDIPTDLSPRPYDLEECQRIVSS